MLNFEDLDSYIFHYSALRSRFQYALSMATMETLYGIYDQNIKREFEIRALFKFPRFELSKTHYFVLSYAEKNNAILGGSASQILSVLHFFSCKKCY